MRKIHIRRFNPASSGKGMVPEIHGGYVPYTDYCLATSRLNRKISRLQDTIVKTRMKEVGV